MYEATQRRYLSEKDRRAIYLHLACGYSKVEAYKETHPNQTAYSQSKNSSTYFRRILKVFDTLPFKAKLEICNLGELRVIEELSKRLDSSNTIFHQGVAVADVPDNKVRQQATELLVKLNGLDKTQENIIDNEDNELKVIIDDGN